MEPRTLLNALAVAERLKGTTRHCYTSNGRRESVAEHSWMMTLMAFFLQEEFPEADMNKVIRMCIIHDLGEAFTGDIPSFEKSPADEDREETLLHRWVASLPASCAREMEELYEEMAQRNTLEAKLYKAIDGLEAVIQHNASDLSTWIPLPTISWHCGRRCGRTPCVSWESSERLCPEKIPCIHREAAGADAPASLVWVDVFKKDTEI